MSATSQKRRKKKSSASSQLPPKSSAPSQLPPPPQPPAPQPCVIHTSLENLPRRKTPLLSSPTSVFPSGTTRMPSAAEGPMRTDVIQSQSSPLLVGPDLRGDFAFSPPPPSPPLPSPASVDTSGCQQVTSSHYHHQQMIFSQRATPQNLSHQATSQPVLNPNQQFPVRPLGGYRGPPLGPRMYMPHQVAPQRFGQRMPPQHLGQQMVPQHLSRPVTPQYLGQQIVPQHLGQQMVPQHLGQPVTPRQLGQQATPQLINSGDEDYPNANLSVEEESLLPSHQKFRPNMEFVKSGKEYNMPKKSLKKSSTKEEAIAAINLKTEEILEDLSSRGKFLPENTMRNVVVDLVRKANQKLLHWRDISAFSEYSMRHGRVEELIKLYCMFTPITTLHDLGVALAQTEGVGSYDELHLGPLIKHPKIKDFFKPPDDLDAPPEITLFKLHKHMRMMDRSKRLRGERMMMEDYLEFVRKKEGLESIQHLCVRIRSFPLLIQMNSRFKGAESRQRKAMEGELYIEIERLLRHEAEQIKRKFSDPRNDDPLSIMKSLSGQNPVDILVKVFEACSKHINQYHRIKVQDFIQSVMSNNSLRHSFLLAIYKGAYSADRLFPSFFEEPGEVTTGPHAQQHMMLCKSEGEVFSELLHRLKDLPFPVDLASLATVERRVSERLGVSQFYELGNGPFLEFIAKRGRLLEEIGGGLMGSGHGASHVETIKEKMLHIINQLRYELRSDDEIVSAAVTEQFSVTQFQELGCGNVQKLISDSQKQNSSSSQGKVIVYLSPLVINSELKDISPPKLPSKSVGILGHQSKEDALHCLNSAPLLEDLCEWSHWDLVFEPQFGKLSDFLLAKCTPGCSPESTVTALELHPGILLRINLSSTMQDFIVAVGDLNATDAAGHLISLIIQRGNSKDISPQLLANHVSTSLEKAKAVRGGDGTSTTTGGCKEEEEAEEIAKFIFKCLLRIPLKLCKLVAAEIFIDPLRKATSSQAVNTLLKFCVTSSQRRFFQALGMSLGIKDWTDDMKVMMEEVRPTRKETLKLEMTHGVYGEGHIPIPTKATPPQAYQTPPPSLIPDLIPPVPSEEEGTQQSVTTSDVPTLLPPQAEVGQHTKKELEEREIECRKIIDTIRHEEFGIGIKLKGKHQKVAEKQREREGRGIKRLSLELYSKDTHFVLELIQNADDNSYPPHFINEAHGLSQTTSTFDLASLKFVIDDQAIIVLNNESGFSEKNVRAICDVGKSTKGAHRSGYIGQKGIGFKSVFRITDIPSIHSNGFHINFDASTNPIGFILPHWCEDCNEYVSHIHQVQRWTTKIILPLKEKLIASNMAKKFNDVRPSLLLFLHRLRSITVEDRVSNTEHHMIRQDRGTGVIEIRHTINSTDVTDRWLVVRKQLDNASQYKPEVDATELAFAFPLPHDQTSIVSSKDLQQQQVFAFLPLRSYGFKFIVQADFDLPSSRESVTSDSTWNQWLREGMPALFLEGLEQIRAYTNQLAEMTEINAVALFLQFVPLEGELLDFFQPLTSQIHTLLRGTNCLPTDPLNKHSKNLLTAPPEDSDLYVQEREEVEWKQPSQILFVRDKFIREHVSQDLLRESLSLSYLHHSLLPHINSSLKNQLNIQSMTIEHLKEVAQVALQYHLDGRDKTDPDGEAYDYGDELGVDDDDDQMDADGETVVTSVPPVKIAAVKWIANWLACVHIVMEESGNEMMMVDKLKDLVILPLSGGSFSAATGNDIFFPPDYRGNDEDETAQGFESIYGEMKVLDLSLFEEGEDLVQSRLRKVLELLGVKNLHPIEVIRHHILPQFREKSHNKKKKLLCGYLRYVKDCIERPGSGVTERDVLHVLKDVAVVLTNKGKMLVKDEVIHFSPGYSCMPDIVAMFPDVNWVVIHEEYLGKNPSAKDKTLWVNFLEKIGVRRGLVVEKVDVKVPKNSERWTDLHSFKRLPAAATDLTLRDWQSPELQNIVDSIAGKERGYQRQQMKKLAELIDSHWDKEYKQKIEASIYDAKNEAYLEAMDASSFSKFLVHRAWLPPEIRNHTLESDSHTLYKGSNLFNIHSETVKKLLHLHAPYVGARLNSTDFLKHLKVQDHIKKKDLLERLVQWSLSSGGDFRTSIDHMINVYTYLLPYDSYSTDYQDDSEIVEKFTEESSALIFIPNRYDEGIPSSENVEGQFLSIREVCWMDPTTVLYYKQKFNRTLPKNLPKILSLHYSLDDRRNRYVEEVFCSKIGIRKTPLITTLIAMLNVNSSVSAHPEDDRVKDFTSIALHLVKECQDQTTLSGSYIYDNLKDARVFPSQNNDVWVTLRDCLLENDDKKLAKSFSKSEKVHFLKWPDQLAARERKGRETGVDEKECFMKLCRITKLKDKVCTLIDSAGMTVQMQKLKEKLSLWVPLIQKFLCLNCESHYASLTRVNIVERLKRLQVLCVQDLKCLYYIEHGDERIYSPEPALRNCELDIDASGIPIIYVSEKKKDKPPSYLRDPLMKLFMSDSSESDQSCFRDFLGSLLLDLPEDESELKEFADSYELCGVLSEGEELWRIPLPVTSQVVIESSEEEEEEEEEEVGGFVETVSDGASKEEKPLTSWPPRSAVDRNDFPHKKHAIAYSNSAKEMTTSKEEGVIDEDDLKEMRKKLLPESEEAGSDAPDSTQVKPQEAGKRDNTWRFSHDDQKLSERGSDSAFDHDYKRGTGHNSSEGHSQTSTNGPRHGAKQHAGPNDRQHQHPDQEVRSKNETPTNDNRKHLDGDGKTNPAENIDETKAEHKNKHDGYHHPHHMRDNYPTTWNAMRSVQEELPADELVDIQHIIEPSKDSDSNNTVMPLTDFTNSGDTEYLLKIGRWGEEYVYQVLSRRGKLPCGRKIKNINWVNRVEETGKPYDVVVELDDDAAGEEGAEVDDSDDRAKDSHTVIYIEVKSTVAEKKDLVIFSWNELKFAEDVSSDYHLYRVYSTGKSSSRLCHMVNLHKYLRGGPVRLMLLL